MRGLVRAALAATALVFAAPVAADVVVDWYDFGQQLEADDSPPYWGADGFHNDSRLALAMFEAANAFDRRYASMVGFAPAPKGASMEAAVITAAHDALVAAHPKHKQDIDYSYELALAGLPQGPARDAGVAVGAAAAKATASLGQKVEGSVIEPYRPRTAAGVWVPVDPPLIRDDLTVLALWSGKPLASFMPPPPPALTSDTWARDFNEVKRLGGASSTDRTSVQSRIARYRITPVITPTLRAIADGPGRTTVQNARMLALLAMASDDAGIVTSTAKLRYNFWRPATAIANADDDGNPATTPDLAWRPFIHTPNFPEYPCAHCSGTAAIAEVLKAEVGNAPPGGVQVGSRSLEFSALQRVPTFDEWVKDVSNSRIYGGVHYRFSADAGEVLGRKVALETLKLLPPIKR